MSSLGGRPTAVWCEPMAYPVADVVAFLPGTWIVDRDIVDSTTGATGTFRGTAEFAPDGESFRWIEAGELQWADDTQGRTASSPSGLACRALLTLRSPTAGSFTGPIFRRAATPSCMAARPTFTAEPGPSPHRTDFN